MPHSTGSNRPGRMAAALVLANYQRAWHETYSSEMTALAPSHSKCSNHPVGAAAASALVDRQREWHQMCSNEITVLAALKNW